MDADATTSARHFTPLQIIAGRSGGHFMYDWPYGDRLVGVEVLDGISHTLHLQRSPDKRTYALGIVVAYWFAHVVFERAVAIGLVLWPKT